MSQNNFLYHTIFEQSRYVQFCGCKGPDKLSNTRSSCVQFGKRRISQSPGIWVKCGHLLSSQPPRPFTRYSQLLGEVGISKREHSDGLPPRFFVASKPAHLLADTSDRSQSPAPRKTVVAATTVYLKILDVRFSKPCQIRDDAPGRGPDAVLSEPCPSP